MSDNIVEVSLQYWGDSARVTFSLFNAPTRVCLSYDHMRPISMAFYSPLDVMAYIGAHQTRSGDATRVQGASQVLREVWQDVGCEPSSRRIRRECGFSPESRLTEHAMDGIGPPGVLVLGRPHISTGAVHMRPDVNCCTPCRIWPMAYYCPLQSMSSIMREKKTFPCDQCSIAQKKAPLLKRHKTQDIQFKPFICHFFYTDKIFGE